MTPEPDSPKRESDSPKAVPGPATMWRRPSARVHSVSSLGDRLLLECARRARQEVEFSLLGIHHVMWRDEGPESQDLLRRHVQRNVADMLRVSDAVYEAGMPGCHVVVLPHTVSSRAKIVARRLQDQIREDESDAIGPVGVERIRLGAEPESAALVMERVLAHFRARTIQPVLGTGTHPQGRQPVGDVRRLEEALRTEINLARRDGTRMCVVALSASAGAGHVPGALACDVDEIAARTVRGCDQVFEVGPACVALILPRTPPDAAFIVADRVVHELSLHDPEAPYGTPDAAVIELDGEHRDAVAILAALRRHSP